MNPQWDLVVFDVSGTLQQDGPTSPTYDFVVDAAQKLSAQGVKVALATNLSTTGLEMFYHHTGLRDLFQTAYCAGMCNPKPNPEMLDLLLLETDVSKERTLMIGDTEADYYFAKNAGVSLCLACWGDAGKRTLSANLAPAYCATDAHSLFKVLNLS